MSQIRVLIVDDSVTQREIFRRLLADDPELRVVAEARNGIEAIGQVTTHAPDVVLMDIHMPEMDGITALKEIKKLNPAAKVIMCSAMGQQAMVIDAIQAGAKDFIVKPFQADRVLEAIGKTLG